MGTRVDAILEAQQPTESPGVHHIHGLAVDRRDPETLYIATHTGLVRLRPNAAPEWIGTHRVDLMGFTAHPRDASLVYASGHPDLATFRQHGVGNLGLLVSRDGGQTWQPVALRGKADFHALTYSPRNGGELYGWSVAEQTGLHRISVRSWAVERLPARGLSDVFSLAASPDAVGPLWAATKTGLTLSRDWGVTWAQAGIIPSGAPVTAVSYHASDARLVYAYVAGPEPKLLRTRDGGATWAPTGFPGNARTPVVALAVGPGESIVLATTDSSVLRSRDGGRTWRPVLNQGQHVRGTR